MRRSSSVYCAGLYDYFVEIDADAMILINSQYVERVDVFLDDAVTDLARSQKLIRRHFAVVNVCDDSTLRRTHAVTMQRYSTSR